MVLLCVYLRVPQQRLNKDACVCVCVRACMYISAYLSACMSKKSRNASRRRKKQWKHRCLHTFVFVLVVKIPVNQSRYYSMHSKMYRDTQKEQRTCSFPFQSEDHHNRRCCWSVTNTLADREGTKNNKYGSIYVLTREHTRAPLKKSVDIAKHAHTEEKRGDGGDE